MLLLCRLLASLLQTVWPLIILFIWEQSDLGLHCLTESRAERVEWSGGESMRGVKPLSVRGGPGDLLEIYI